MELIYVIELKVDKSAQAALAQINAKDYALPFYANGRQVVKIGVNFCTKTRTIADWVVEPGNFAAMLEEKSIKKQQRLWEPQPLLLG